MRISDWSSDVCSSDLLDLALFAARISGGQAFARLQFADRLGHLEPLGEHIDERRVDIVDALAVAAQLVVHGSAAPVFFGTLGTGKGAEASRKSLQNSDRGAKARRVMTATIHKIHGQRPPSLYPLMTLVAADINEVNSVILDRMQSEVQLIPELAVTLIAGG